LVKARRSDSICRWTRRRSHERPRSILLADDEEKILKRLGRALRDEGHEVVEASSAREAQRQLGERSFDLFVVDNLMPGMTGLELIREVSASCRNRSVRRSS
jgi:CheY-like chemotaxis protein